MPKIVTLISFDKWETYYRDVLCAGEVEEGIIYLAVA